MSSIRIVLSGALVLCALAAAWSLMHIVPLSGAGANLSTKLVDQCRRVEVAPGTEDVTIDPQLKLAFISAGDHRGAFSGEELSPKVGIYALSLDGSDTVRRVSPALENFRPHGISEWRGADGTRRLFVINHAPGGEQIIEIFDVAVDGLLTQLESISFDAMTSPNDLVAVGPRQFYVTNDRRFNKGLMSALETYLALPFSSVAYFDGSEGRIVKKGLTYANGINVSADGAQIYVGELIKRRIMIFNRTPETGALKRAKSIAVNTAPDNIEVSGDGALWVAGHSKVFDFLKHAKDPSKTAPSHIIRLNVRNGLASDVLVSVNGEINGSSVGAVWDSTLIVGGVFDGHVMVCPMLEILLRGPAVTPPVIPQQ